MFLFNTIKQESDERLMWLIAKGKKKAFETLYDRYFNKLVQFAKGHIGEIQLAEDIVQEVFIVIIEKPEKFDTSKRFSTWVYTLVNNACRNRYRNQTNRAKILAKQQTKETTEAFTDPTTVDHNYLKQKIQDLLADCSEKEQIIYVLRFEEAISLSEIAQILNLPIGSVKSCIFYLLKKLAPHLKEFNYE